jgi:hypothetical protein
MTGEKFSDWFRTTVGVRQGCPLSPVLFNLFLERIMKVTLEGHCGGVRCAGRRLNDLRFADDIDIMDEDMAALQEVTGRLERTVKRYGMEISTEKSKVMMAGKPKDTENQVVNVMVDGVRLEQVRSFTYLGSRIEDNGNCQTWRFEFGLEELQVRWQSWKTSGERKTST